MHLKLACHSMSMKKEVEEEKQQQGNNVNNGELVY